MNGSYPYSKYVFLLGGADLEMEEIRKILVEKELKYYDNNLKWGARLSSYEPAFDEEHIFIGIELIADCTKPSHYIEIDHHNENSFLPSSLEQVAGLINIELTHDQMLIAANDKGYIPALIEKDATMLEIASIRYRDRQAQGISDEDEKLAEKSILDNCSKINGITIIKALTSRFAAITDRLYPFERLLIYTDIELNYYGENLSRLTLGFDELIKQNKAYSGGGENGYFGLTGEGISSIGNINAAIEQIINLVKNGK